MQHEMRLKKAPFEMIKNGTKQIESRLWDEKRRKISIGDEIVFRLEDDSSQTVKTTVLDILHFPTFQKLFTALPPEQFGGQSSQELTEQIRNFYSEEDEKRYGVVGIRLLV